jgi:hypothetical protein
MEEAMVGSMGARRVAREVVGGLSVLWPGEGGYCEVVALRGVG